MTRSSLDCPSWPELYDRRDRDAAGEGRWRRAIEHARECEGCHRAALAIDPLSMFAVRGAPPVDAAAEAAEVEAMQRAVATVRRHRKRPVPRRIATAWRVAAAAVLLIVAAWAATVPRPEAGGVAAPASVQVEAVGAEMPPAPAFEQLDPPAARVYQLHEQGLSVVMIVDETLDV